MKSKHDSLVPEDHRCRQCKRGKNEVMFSVKIYSYRKPEVYSRCNKCYYANRRKTPEDRKRIVKKKIADYFKREYVA